VRPLTLTVPFAWHSKVLPAQAEQFSAPHTGDQPKVKQSVQPLTSSRIQEGRCLFWRPGFTVDFRSAWRIDQFSDVAGNLTQRIACLNALESKSRANLEKFWV
jgi:hypothetical protein